MRNVVEIRKNGSRRILQYCEGESMTKQSFKKECDINFLIGKYQKTGQLPELMKSNPVYGDFSSVPSYHEGLNIVKVADEQFGVLNSGLRKRFDNDPAKFLNFVNNPDNLDEMYKLGLAIKPKVAGEPALAGSTAAELAAGTKPLPGFEKELNKASDEAGMGRKEEKKTD